MSRLAASFFTFWIVGGLASQMTKEKAIDVAKEILEEQQDVAGTPVVREARAVDWPDTSLGCPEKGKSYAQVVTPGFKVLLQLNTKVYRVHVGDGRAVVCGKPLERRRARKQPERVPKPEETEITGEVPEDILDAILDDLTQRTDAEANAIQQLRAESHRWSDGSLGCPKPGEVYTQVPVDGYRVVLEYDDQQYDYRVTKRGYFFLCEGSPTREIQ
jgi:hypothetical protein